MYAHILPPRCRYSCKSARPTEPPGRACNRAHDPRPETGGGAAALLVPMMIRSCSSPCARSPQQRFRPCASCSSVRTCLSELLLQKRLWFGTKWCFKRYIPWLLGCLAKVLRPYVNLRTDRATEEATRSFQPPPAALARACWTVAVYLQRLLYSSKILHRRVGTL